MTLIDYAAASWSFFDSGDFAGRLIAGDPTIVADGDIYRMFYTDGEYQDGGTVIRPVISQAVSTDGQTWTQIGGNISTGTAVSGEGMAEPHLETACVFRRADGSFVLLYSAYPDEGDPVLQFPATLHAATSTDGINFTAVSPDPILVGTPGGYDSDAIFSPTVASDGNGGFVMIYTGHGYGSTPLPGAPDGITLLAATSPDGITWTKHPTPVLLTNPTDPAYAWMAEGVAEAALIVGPDGKYYLFFTALETENRRSIGLAVADDPLGPWEVAPEPIITPEDAGLLPYEAVLAPHAELVDGVLRLWYTKHTYPDGPFNPDGSPKDGVVSIAYAESIWEGTAGSGAMAGAPHWLGTAVDDTIVGSAVDERVTAMGGDDTILTAGGTDTIDAGEGDDLVFTEDGNHSVRGGAGNDTLIDEVGGADTIDGEDGADLIAATFGADLLIGGAGDDVLDGAADDDTLDGGTGNDALYGGDGADSLGGGDGIDELRGGSGDDRLHGGALGDVIDGDVGDDTADYSGSDGVAVALDGSEAATGDAAGDSLVSIENLVGSATGTDLLVGDASANRLEGLGGDDTLEGGFGDDTLMGGEGVDTARFAIGSGAAVVTYDAALGTFTVVSSLGTDVLAGIEYIAFGNETVATPTYVPTPDTLAPLLTAISPADGATGIAVSANIVLTFDEAVLAGAGSIAIRAADATLWRSIDAADGTQVAIAGNTVTIDPGVAFDPGGSYSVTIAAGAFTDAAGNAFAGLDETTAFGFATSLNLLLVGTAGADSLTGAAEADTLAGVGGEDTLDGGAGADSLAGGTGDDLYVVDDVGDIVAEAPGAGLDTVRTSIALTLAQDVENLVVDPGLASGLALTGNGLGNAISGGAGHDTLDGGAGADTLAGGAGDDTYVVDATGDVVTEAPGGGSDTIITSIGLTLAAEVEALAAAAGATAALALIGNAANNVIAGGGGGDTLDGGLGADTLAGGAGNDAYVVDHAGDVVVEAAGTGTDIAYAAIGTTLADNVENLAVATGIAAGLALVGNALGNIVTGGTGADTLDGGLGADTLVGGAGNDTFVIDDAADLATESAGGGTDTVGTSVSLTLGANIEALVVQQGVSAGLALTGNGGANAIDGGAGNDTLDGGAGTDTLAGGAGDDLYILATVGDIIAEQVGAGTDTVRTGASLALGANLENVVVAAGVTANLNLTGNALDNVVAGGGGRDSILGGTGNDQAMGAAGADTLVGGTGNDTLAGGAGSDRLQGDAGLDAFLFDAALDARNNVDRVIAFSTADDTILLENAIFTALGSAPGALSASAWRSGARVTTAGDATDRIIYNTSNGDLYYDADGSGGAAAIRFATIDNRAALSAGDFLIV